MKNQKGISLITLVVTMVVMVILIGVVGTYSLENINKSNEAVFEMEFSQVREFVLNMQSKILLEDHKFDTTEIGLTNELLYLLAEDHLSNVELNNIVDVNASNLSEDRKYYFISFEQELFEDYEFTKGNITVQDVKSDYIVNFYTGTVIAFREDKCKVDGLIMGLSEIIALD